MAPVDDRPVWSVVCFFVTREWRGRGVTVRLLEAAARHAAAHGATLLEGYPIAAKSRQSAAFVWTGLASAFEVAGFEEVARRSATRPVMRRALRARRLARGTGARARCGHVAELVHAPIDVAALIAAAARPDCGALAVFLGTTRDHHDGRRVVKLEYEAYEPMALVRALARLERPARERFAIASCVIRPRLGRGPLTEARASRSSSRRPHPRGGVRRLLAGRWTSQAQQLPIWKREIYAEGRRGLGGGGTKLG
jgi:molybdopterin synthase catalytic subunit